MPMPKRSILPAAMVVCILLMAGAAAPAEMSWPASLHWTVGVSSDDTSRVQMSAHLKGPIGENLGLTVGGWWITGGSDNRAFAGDNYIDYDKSPLYLAAGRKFVPFGPAGVLVSPGLEGAELGLSWDRVKVRAITGELAFTPATGQTRFTYAGNRVPLDEDVDAARAELALTGSDAVVPVTVGFNWLDVLGDDGTSWDLSLGLSQEFTLYGEVAEYADADATVYGVRWTDMYRRPGSVKHTIVVVYDRDIEVGFVPAAVGATQFFEGQDGIAGGIYHQFAPRRAIGVYGDSDDVIVTLFGTELF